MATSFEDTPKWFNADFYLESKLANLIVEDPKGNWSRPSLLEAFKAAGFDNPYDHYVDFGDKEGLSPNPLFNSTEYLAAKTAQLGSTWTPEMVAEAIDKAGMTLMQHYEKFGSAEGLSPSSAFNQDKYYDAKLDQLKTTEPDKGWTLDTLKAAFAAAGLTPLDHYLEYAKAENLAEFDYSDNGAPIPHPGNKITLTTGADIATPDATVEGFKTSSRDDVISGVVSAKSTEGTFGANDVIDGGTGVDILTLNMKGDFTYKTGSTGSVKNVDSIVLNNGTVSGFTFDAKGVEGADVYTVNGGDKGNLTIKNVDSAQTGYILKQAAGKFEVQINDGVLTGKEDNVEIALNGVGTGEGVGAVALTVKGSNTGKVEGVTLTAEGKDNFVTLTQGHTSATVMGAGNLNVGVATGLVDFNASNAAGKVDANLSASLATLKTIKGGTAEDTFTLNGALSGTAVVDGGDGIDTLKFGTLADKTTIKSAITGVETFEVTAAAAAATVTFDLSKVEGLKTIKIGGVTDVVSSGDFVVGKAAAYDTMNLQVANELKSVKSFAYDGMGVLNVSLAGDMEGFATGNDTELTTLTANNITDLVVSNTAEHGVLTIDTLNATALTSLTINSGTGESGGVAFNGTAAKLNSLETITLNGGAGVDFVHGTSSSKLHDVNATGLTDDLSLDLSEALLAGTEGVTITMGDGGASIAGGGLIGTTKADTFILSTGIEQVGLTVSTSAAYDLLQNFDANDFIKLENASGTSVATYSTAYSSTAFIKATIHGFKSAGLDLQAVGDDAAVDKAVTAELKAKVGSTDQHGAVTTSDLWYFAVDNGDSIGIYQAVAKGDVTASASGTAGTFNGVTLVGILNGGITLDQLTDEMFV